ncbi:MAG: TonB-dependent receptor, partial [Parvularcula sp.]|nr:TonB-dependent receptor [Parvularcula sp.]
ATVSTGFKSGGFNSEGAFPNLTRDQRGFAPEETTNYELGFKSQLLNNTLQLNATVFRMDIEDFQDRAFDGITLLVRNAGELRQQGIETDFIWAPIDQLSFIGGVSYLDSEFEEYLGASPLPGGAPQDLSGERNHFSPEW